MADAGVLGILLFALLAGSAAVIYGLATQRGLVKGFLPQSAARTQQALAQQATALARQEESLSLQRATAERYEQSLAQADESVKLQREAVAQMAECLRLQQEANELLRAISSKLDQQR